MFVIGHWRCVLEGRISVVLAAQMRCVEDGWHVLPEQVFLGVGRELLVDWPATGGALPLRNLLQMIGRLGNIQELCDMLHLRIITRFLNIVLVLSGPLGKYKV